MGRCYRIQVETLRVAKNVNFNNYGKDLLTENFITKCNDTK